MDEAALHDARLELLDAAIATLRDTPDEAFVEGLLREGVERPEAGVDPALDEAFAALERFLEAERDRPVEAVTDRLTAEYTRLFVGLRPTIVAHETYYREDTDYLGEGLADVQAAYDAVGWSSPDDYPEEDDFVAVELAFLRHLVARQREGDEAAVAYERTFLDEHLLVWVDEFAADLRSETDEDLYLAAAWLVEGVAGLEDELVTA